MRETYFTDEEYRLVLRALSRERDVCKKVDEDCGEDHKLIRLMNVIDKKIKHIQYNPPLSKSLGEIALQMSDECDDCPCSTYEECKKEIFPDDDLSDVCMKHKIHWLTEK